MTGTAETEAPEFDKIYKLEVLAIPTNRPLIRVENPDVVFRTEREKFEAVLAEIKELNAIGRPVLVGTISIEKSEHLSTLLKKAGIKHVVLNAKYHEREAEIVAQAGRFGAVTIATNMAGRGTDIILGGVPDYRDEGHAHRAGDRLRPGHPGAARRGRRPRRSRGDGRRVQEGAGREEAPPEERHDPGQALRRASWPRSPPEHPSVLVMRELALGAPVLRAYLDGGARPCPAPPRRRSPRASTPRARSPSTSSASIR